MNWMQDHSMDDVVELDILGGSRETRQWLLEGEKIEEVDTSTSFLVGGHNRFDGRLVISNYRLVFECHRRDENENQLAEVRLGNILKIEKTGTASGFGGKGDVYGIVISTKDNNQLRFACGDREGTRKSLVEILNKNAFPSDHERSLFAFTHCAAIDRPRPLDGWNNVYDGVKELARLGVPSKTWVLTDINDKYQLSSTYPRVLAVPAVAAAKGKEFLRKVAEFRSKQRFAVLSWLHPTSNASLTRCSQPLPGITNKRCSEDETYMHMLLGANANGHQLFIFDARPTLNATVNRAKGGGSDEEYDRCSLQFLNIQNIHVVRDSLRKVMDALCPRINQKTYLKEVEESKWLAHLQTVLEGAQAVVDALHSVQCSVLVHCSDGWDRTSQLTSLAMLLLDPYYRTLEGFAVLIEKEWCSFGHKFAQRSGHGKDASSDSERSPIFVQFLDCVWQVMRQFAVHFEFSSSFLIAIADELYSCQYGTFLYNCEKERRVDYDCTRLTLSVWPTLFARRNEMLNPLYLATPSVLSVNASLRCLRVWTDYYGRNNEFIMSEESSYLRRAGLRRACGMRALLEELVSRPDSSHV